MIITTAATCPKCARCGRALKNAKAIQAGMGRTCAKKAAAEQLARVKAEEAAAAAMPVPGCDAVEPAAPTLADKLAALDGKVRTSKRFPGLTVEFAVHGTCIQLVVRRGTDRGIWEVLPGKSVCITRGTLDYQARNAATHFAYDLAAKLAA